MKIRRVLAAVMTAAMMMSVMTACSSDEDKKADDKETEKSEVTEKAKEESSADNYIEYNGVKLRIGGKFADVKDGLGETSAPDETITPCGEGDQMEIYHHYAGISVMENSEGVIIYVDTADYYEDHSAVLNGKITIGSPIDDVKEALSEPDDEGEYYMTYQFDLYSLDLSLDPEAGAVIGFTFNGAPSLYI